MPPMNRQENRESSKILNAKGNTTKPKFKPGTRKQLQKYGKASRQQKTKNTAY
jgi:hypothetical protein